MAKLAAVKAPYDIVVKDYPIPQPQEDGLVIKVEAACVCGSDLHLTSMDMPRRYPGVIGHEFAGRVVAMGKRAHETIHCYGGDLKVGDRIVVYPHIACQKCSICMTYGNGNCSCENDWIYGGTMMDKDERVNHDPDLYPHFKGGFGEYVHIFPNTFVWKLPDDMPSKIAALLDPLAVAMRAVEQTMTSVGGYGEGLSTNSKALIIGAGPIGVMCGMILKTMGVEQLIISDMLDKKLEMAKEIAGADVVLNVSGLSCDEKVQKVFEVTGGTGANIVINCANHPSSIVEGLQMVAVLGHYVEIGNAISFGRIINTELCLSKVVFERNAHITSVVANGPATFDRAFRLLKRHREIPFAKLLTHEFHSLDDLLPTIKMMRNEDYLKGVLVFEE